MAYKNGVLTIDNWYDGMKNHPIAGFGLLQNVEVFENRGLLKLKNSLDLDTSITPNSMPIAYLKDESGNEYVLTGRTGSSKIYKNGTEISGSSLNSASDMTIFKNYVFVRHGQWLSSYGPLTSGSAQWFTGSNGFTTDYNGALLSGQDDFLYVADGNSVIKIEVTEQPAGTTPTLATSATLDLKDGQYATCLEEFGTDIVIGTQTGGSYGAISSSPGARLYSWNRQAGTLGNPGLADLPVIFDENGVNTIKQKNNRLYVSAGAQGNIYVTDSVNYSLVTQIPYAKEGINAQSLVYLNAIDFSQRGTLLVGISSEQLDGSIYPGIYEIDIRQSGNPVSYRTVSGKSDTDYSWHRIGLVNSVTYNQTKVGWFDDGTEGLDTTGTSLASGFSADAQSPLYKVGTANRKKTFTHVEWTLADPLSTGQSIRLSYRKNSSGAWTTLKTWDYATYGAITDFEDQGSMADLTYVQLRVELEDTSGGAESNLNLISVTLW